MHSSSFDDILDIRELSAILWEEKIKKVSQRREEKKAKQ